MQEYLLSYAPLTQFYIFFPPGNDGVMIKFFDEMGVSWDLMEDDDVVVGDAVRFLESLNVKAFKDRAELLAYEREVSAQVKTARPASSNH